MTQNLAVARDSLACFDFDSLLTSAARLRPDRPALGDSTGVRLTHRDFDARARALAARLLDHGLVPGECLLLAGGARASTVVVMVAALRAGLDVALAPPHLGADELAAFAAEAGAVALASETRHGELAPLDSLFEAAALTSRARLVFGLDGAGEDAVDLDWNRDDPGMAATARRPPREGAVLTWRDGAVSRHAQQAIVAAAMELLPRARIGMANPVYSTLAPTRFATLAAGPVAALLAGCPLRFHGPFDAAGFVAGIDECAPAHLVAPRALFDALAAGGQRGDAFASLLLSRNGGAPPPPRGEGVPFVDLDGFDGAALAPRYFSK